MIHIIYKQPNLPPRLMQIPNKLNVLQNLVGGDIQAKEIYKNIVMITSQDGQLREQDANFKYGFVTIYGPAIFAGIDRKKYISIEPEQAGIILDIIGGTDDIPS